VEAQKKVWLVALVLALAALAAVAPAPLATRLAVSAAAVIRRFFLIFPPLQVLFRPGGGAVNPVSARPEPDGRGLTAPSGTPGVGRKA
jgi:hypothetical protein